MSQSKMRTLVSLSLFLGIIIILHYLGSIRFIENGLRRVITPGSKLVYRWSISVGGTTEEFGSPQELEQAYTILKEKLLEQQIDVIHTTLLEDENQSLRAQLDFFTSTTLNHVGAEIVGKNIESLGSTLVINRGEIDHVEIGDPVVASRGVLVGKVVRVEKHTSIVRLINDHQSRIAATVMNKEKSIGLVEGGFDISVQMTFIPQNEVIRIGELVITSGLEEKIPRGLLIGEVIAVEKEAYQPFQEAIITPSIDFDSLELVSIIRNHQ